MLGIDADYSMSRAYQSQGWPSFIVVDPAGVVRFHGFDPDRRLAALRRCVQELVDKQPEPPGPKPVLDERMAFPESVLASRRAPRDRSPRVAFASNGDPLVTYYSNREGTHAVYLRHYNQRGDPIEQSRVSPAGLESYAPDCAVDTLGTLWLTWCGGSNGFYDIYVQARRPGKPPVMETLTRSPDDAMSPKIAMCPGATVTFTYYEWRMLGGNSRDRNIYARTYDPAKRSWANSVEISPPKPEVEDHSDPDVVIDQKGNSWIVWSFDYHPSLYKKPLPASEPTIFAAKLAAGAVSAPVLVGGTGEIQGAIDFFPSAALDAQGRLWCAWDCSEPRRAIRLAQVNETGTAKLVSTFGTNQGICSTPELSPAGADLLLAWSQRLRNALWEGRIALLKDGKAVTTVSLVENADVLFPQAQQSPAGQFWVAYEKTDANGSEIVVRNVTEELKGARAASNGSR